MILFEIEINNNGKKEDISEAYNIFKSNYYKKIEDYQPNERVKSHSFYLNKENGGIYKKNENLPENNSKDYTKEREEKRKRIDEGFI